MFVNQFINQYIMKKTTILIMLFASAFTATSQTSKGSMMVGGSVGFSSSKNNTTITDNGVSITSSDNKFSNSNVSPTFSYFLADGIALGLNINFYSNSTIDVYPTVNGTSFKEAQYENKGTGFGLLARKYFIKDDNKFGFYGDLGFGVGPTIGKDSYTPVVGTAYSHEREGSSTNVNLGLGVAYFPTKSIGLHAGVGGLGWNKSNTKTTYSNSNSVTTESSGFNFNLNSLNINFGFNFFFGGK